MLSIFRSNRLERLADRLATSLSGSGRGDPLAPDLVVVHSPAMARWLSQMLSQRLGAAGGAGGVCANVDFRFLGHVVSRVLAAVGDEGAGAAGADPWSPGTLAWTLWDVLEGSRSDPALAPVVRYLDAGGEAVEPAARRAALDRRGFDLVRHLADVFDRYAVSRPEWALAWAAGERAPHEPDAASLEWQRHLFRAVAVGLGAPSLAERTNRARRHLRDGRPVAGLPAAIDLFGLTTMPASLLEVFLDVARHVDVRLYLLCFSDAYWGHVHSRREIAVAQRRSGGLVSLADLHLEEGNPLLAGFGRAARDFQVVLESRDPLEHEAGDVADFVDPERDGPPTVLSTLQADVLWLRHRHPPRASEEPDERRPLPRLLTDGDDSLSVHVCHGRVRQVEVLRDVLLDLLDRHREIEPRDVVVLTPDIEAFAPLVSAVFADGRERPLRGHGVSPDDTWGAEGSPRLPYSIADRSVRDTNPVAECLLRLVALAGERLTASGALGLLACEPIRRRFEIEPDEVPRIEAWLVASGVRWGVDEADREAQRQPRERANTFAAGLDRLLLGVAMPGEGRRLFEGVLPVDDLEGGNVVLLGKLVGFCRALFGQLAALRDDRDVPAWVDALRACLAALTAVPAGSEWLAQQVHEALATLETEAGGAAGRPVARSAVAAALDRALALEVGAVGHHTGAITFCSLGPLRSIPKKVVCLLGLDREVFPRRGASLGFDLVAAAPRLGDHDVRDEDRLLLLESLLAAREHFVVTYGGRDIRTNDAIPPPAPLAELLEVVDDSFVVDGARRGRASRRVVFEHPLQPFSPRCFGGEGSPAPTSFDRAFFDGARAAGDEELPPFFGEPLPPPAAAAEAPPPTLDELVRFFQNPARHLLQRRLGIYFPGRRGAVEDREPIEPDGLEAWAIGADVLAAGLEGRDLEATYDVVRASGRLPLGAGGRAFHAEVVAAAAGVLDKAREHLGPAPGRVDVAFVVDGLEIRGQVDGVHGSRRLAAQYGAIGPKQLVDLWIQHLALCAARPDLAPESVLVGRDDPKGVFKSGVVRLAPLAAAVDEIRHVARDRLRGLVGLYRLGLSRPLLFFPKASWAYYSAADRGDPQAGLHDACETWRPAYESAHGRPEGDDPYYLQAFGRSYPFVQPDGEVDESFAAAAAEVFGHLTQAVVEAP